MSRFLNALKRLSEKKEPSADEQTVEDASSEAHASQQPVEDHVGSQALSQLEQALDEHLAAAEKEVQHQPTDDLQDGPAALDAVQQSTAEPDESAEPIDPSPNAGGTILLSELQREMGQEDHGLSQSEFDSQIHQNIADASTRDASSTLSGVDLSSLLGDMDQASEVVLEFQAGESIDREADDDDAAEFGRQTTFQAQIEPAPLDAAPAELVDATDEQAPPSPETDATDSPSLQTSETLNLSDERAWQLPETNPWAEAPSGEPEPQLENPAPVVDETDQKTLVDAPKEDEVSLNEDVEPPSEDVELNRVTMVTPARQAAESDGDDELSAAAVDSYENEEVPVEPANDLQRDPIVEVEPSEDAEQNTPETNEERNDDERADSVPRSAVDLIRGFSFAENSVDDVEPKEETEGASDFDDAPHPIESIDPDSAGEIEAEEDSHTAVTASGMSDDIVTNEFASDVSDSEADDAEVQGNDAQGFSADDHFAEAEISEVDSLTSDAPDLQTAKFDLFEKEVRSEFVDEEPTSLRSPTPTIAYVEEVPLDEPVLERPLFAKTAGGEFETALKSDLSDAQRMARYREVSQDIGSKVPHEIPASVMLVNLTDDRENVDHVVYLAACLADDEQGEILIIDADFSSQATSRKFELADSAGLSEILDQKTDWRQAVRRSSIDRLSVLPAGRQAVGNLSAAAAGFSVLIHDLRQTFRFILVDAGSTRGPVAGTLTRYCDMTYALLDPEQSDLDVAAQAVSRLRTLGGRLVGAILI